MTLFDIQRNARAERRALGNRKSRKQARKLLRWRKDFIGKRRAARIAIAEAAARDLLKSKAQAAEAQAAEAQAAEAQAAEAGSEVQS